MSSTATRSLSKILDPFESVISWKTANIYPNVSFRRRVLSIWPSTPVVVYRYLCVTGIRTTLLTTSQRSWSSRSHWHGRQQRRLHGAVCKL